MRLSTLCMFTLITLLLASGCAQRPGIKDSTTTEDGRFRVTWWQTPPRPIEANSYFELFVEVEDLTDDEEPYDLRFDATMPAHRHGMNMVASPTRFTRDSWIVRDLLLHMPGEWVMTFDVTDQNGVLHRASETVILD
jgi:hypothetical protein